MGCGGSTEVSESKQPGHQTKKNGHTSNGVYNEKYTIKQIYEHNSRQGFCDLFPWRRSVCLQSYFKDAVQPHVRMMEAGNEVKDPDYYDGYNQKLNFNDNWLIHPTSIVHRHGLNMKMIINCIKSSKVAELSVVDGKSYWEDIKRDADMVSHTLKNEHEITVYQRQYMEVLDRFFQLYDGFSGNIPCPELANGDPNEVTFPLPKDVAANPEDIRLFVFSNNFDFNIPEGGAWSMYELNVVFAEFKESLIPEQIYRTELYSTEEDTELLGSSVLSHDIQGEAAWDVIPQSIFQEDTTTPEQDAIWENRSKRTDLNDLERMQRRRNALADYFIQTHTEGQNPEYCHQFMGFVDSLDKSWNQFLELCEKE